jgi:cell division septation protein DedD
MADTNLDLQTEMFKDSSKKRLKKPPTKDQDNSVFNLALFKNTKIMIPFDTLLIILIMFIFIVMTFYFLGMQHGKNIKQQTIVTVETTTTVSKEKSIASPSSIMSVSFSEDKTTTRTPKRTGKPQQSLSTPAASISRKRGTKRILKKYTIQVGASRDSRAVDKEIQKLQKKGYDAFVIPYTSTSGKKWYKICIGRFESSTEAITLIKKLKRKEGKRDCFLTHV